MNQAPTWNLPLAITGALALLAAAAAVSSAMTRPGLRLDTAQRARTVVQGSTAVFTVRVRREHGLNGPVTLGVWGLPRGSRRTWKLPNGRVLKRKRPGRWSVVLPAGRDRVLLVVRTTRRTRLGRVAARVAAKTRHAHTRRWLSIRVVRRAAAPEPVADDRPFGMSGHVAAALRPGSTQPVDLQLTNPYDFALLVTDLHVALDDATSRRGCSGSADYAVRQFSGAYPIVLPPGETALGELVPDQRLWPRVSMLDLPRNQDACRGARLTLRFEGAATR